MPAVALGNCAVVVPSPVHSLAATDLSQIFQASDLPPGVVNVVTGGRDMLAEVLASHDEVAGVWYVGSSGGGAVVERASAGNSKATWVRQEDGVDWFDPRASQGHAFLRRAGRVKTVWIPYGSEDASARRSSARVRHGSAPLTCPREGGW